MAEIDNRCHHLRISYQSFQDRIPSRQNFSHFCRYPLNKNNKVIWINSGPSTDADRTKHLYFSLNSLYIIIFLHSVHFTHCLYEELKNVLEYTLFHFEKM